MSTRHPRNKLIKEVQVKRLIYVDASVAFTSLPINSLASCQLLRKISVC